MVRVGILGLGLAGGLLVPYLSGHPRARLAGAADLDPVLRDRLCRDHDVTVHEDAESLLRRDDIDAVYIATPHQFHKEHALLAARHGKHLVVEKPMALTLPDCDAMIEAAERNRVALIVGHTHSFDPAILLMKNRAATGEFGRLAMVAMYNYTDFLYRPRRPEELDTAKGGGILFNQVPHQVDVARLLAGSPLRSVRATAGILDPDRPTEGCCMVFLEFDNGVAASLVYSGYDHFDSDEMHSWIGSTGRRKTPRHGSTRKALASLADRRQEMELRTSRYGYGGDAEVLRSTPEGQPHFGSLIATYAHADVRPSPQGLLVYADNGVTETLLPAEQNGRTSLIDELCSVVLDGAAPLHDGNFARATVEACLAIHDSSRQRREIVLPLR